VKLSFTLGHSEDTRTNHSPSNCWEGEWLACHWEHMYPPRPLLFSVFSTSFLHRFVAKSTGCLAGAERLSQVCSDILVAQEGNPRSLHNSTTRQYFQNSWTPTLHWDEAKTP
jgi:hypothetical protein